jgi:hypothetical protein
MGKIMKHLCRTERRKKGRKKKERRRKQKCPGKQSKNRNRPANTFSAFSSLCAGRNFLRFFALCGWAGIFFLLHAPSMSQSQWHGMSK